MVLNGGLKFYFWDFYFFHFGLLGLKTKVPRGSCKYKAVDAVGGKNSVVEMSVSIMYLYPFSDL